MQILGGKKEFHRDLAIASTHSSRMKRVKFGVRTKVPAEVVCFFHLPAIKNIFSLLHVYLIILLEDKKKNLEKHVFPFPQLHCSCAGSSKSSQSVNKADIL